jgi:hypothetical protein
MNQSEQSTTLGIDTSVIAILPYDTTQLWIFKDGRPTELSSKDISQIDTILNKCVNDYNPEQEIRFNKFNIDHPEFKEYPELKPPKKAFLIYLQLYKRQYVAIINLKGEKEVWVNCFCTPYFMNIWKTKPIVVEDGGNCYFNLKVNLTTGQYYDLYVNHEA